MTPTMAAPALATARAVLPRLLAIEPGRERIVSCYVRLAPADRTNQQYLGEVKASVPAALEDRWLRALPREGRLALERDLERIEAFLAQPSNLPPARGLALFACEALDLFEAVPLPRVHRTRLVIDRTPAVGEMIALWAALQRVIVVVLDRVHARFFLVGPFDTEELPCLTSAATRGGKFHSNRHGAPGFGEGAYHHRIRTERERHYDAVARCLRTVTGERRVEGIVLAGVERDTNAVARFLKPPLAARVWGTAHLNPTAVSAAEVAHAADAAREAHDRVADREAIAQWAEGMGTGWATAGIRETLGALGRGQVRTLLVAAGATGRGYRCSRTGLLVLAREDCGGQGIPIEIPDLIDDAVEEALRQGIDVQTIDHPEDAARLDGLGALLRFR